MEFVQAGKPSALAGAGDNKKNSSADRPSIFLSCSLVTNKECRGPTCMEYAFKITLTQKKRLWLNMCFKLYNTLLETVHVSLREYIYIYIILVTAA